MRWLDTSKAPANGQRLKRSLSWHHPALFLVVLAGLLVYVIVALIVRQTAKIEVGICDTHRRRRLVAIAAGWLVFLSGVGIFIAATSCGQVYLTTIPRDRCALCGQHAELRILSA